MNYIGGSCILSKFYIKPQLLADEYSFASSCILSKFYIKPQLWPLALLVQACCILSKFYIKPQQRYVLMPSPACCILSKFYIKPQHGNHSSFAISVVSYRNSTSNHNAGGGKKRGCAVVSYRNSTSNHNLRQVRRLLASLYLIEILHQTTTFSPMADGSVCCILSKFYIKPQPQQPAIHGKSCCILSKFYIKPQRRASY